MRVRILCALLSVVAGLLAANAFAKSPRTIDATPDAGQLPSAPRGELPASVIYARVRSSTVVVHTELAQGSGIVVAAEEVATNFHVVRGGKSIRITQGAKEWTGTVTRADPKRDLAIIHVSALGLPHVPTRAFATINVGERIYAVGSPEGLELTISDGLISALRPVGGDLPPIQITAPISHGSSGGGLFDSSGRLIGITTAVAKQGQNLNFAVPAEWLSALPGLDGGADSLLLSEAPAQFDVGRRPEAVVCSMSSETMWGLFTGGDELLEDKQISETWTIERLNTQSPLLAGTRPDDDHPDQLVLFDMNRSAEWVEFRPVRGPGPLYTLFVGESGLTLLAISPKTVYGEPRYVLTYGSCAGTTSAALHKKEPVALPGWAVDKELCERGNELGCLSIANGLMRGPAYEANEAEAVIYFKKACDLHSVEGCATAGQLYEKAGMKERARAAYDAACRLGHKPSCP